MAQRVAELGEATAEREGDPSRQEIGSAKQTLGWREGQDIGLLEVGVRGVDNQGNAGGHFMPELQRQRVIARFGISERRGGKLGFGAVVVQVDVGSAYDPPVQLPVLDLVLPEREKLGVGGGNGEDGKDGKDQEAPRGGAGIPLRPLRHLRHLRHLRMMSPWLIRVNALTSPTTRPNTV